ncbi:helix-turn-helix domain-containing protein [Companilactobacillus insicii]|uniref:helix-turn-helix domain-containing protein n=1 Tax=Companilactobacillus insicii TaxID=1732567 RepID=UPI000F7B6D22|nr:helix-turn-helix domain-containing protein [Companilactobacillus insicii]
MSETIGQRIQDKRMEKSMTQEQVAEKLYVTQQTVARWESGKHNPPISAIQDLSKLFDVNTSYFFAENEVIIHKFNFFAFFGSLIINFLFFGVVAIALITMQLAFWGTICAFLVSPIIVIWLSVIKIQPLTSFRVVSSVVLCLISVIMIPVLWKLTKYIWKILQAYYRYNINSIFYEVVSKK